LRIFIHRRIKAKWNINDIDTEIKSPFKPQIQLTSVLGNEIKLEGENIIKYIEEHH